MAAHLRNRFVDHLPLVSMRQTVPFAKLTKAADFILSLYSQQLLLFDNYYQTVKRRNDEGPKLLGSGPVCVVTTSCDSPA